MTVLNRIFSIVCVQSSLLNLDTHTNHDDELELVDLSAKLTAMFCLITFHGCIDERSDSLLLREFGGSTSQLSGFLYYKVKVENDNLVSQ